MGQHRSPEVDLVFGSEGAAAACGGEGKVLRAQRPGCSTAHPPSTVVVVIIRSNRSSSEDNLQFTCTVL